jgi:uncharacterized RDD family membrane protein YckC
VHNARDLVVDSVTGVDLALPVAGPGARSYAFLIDWAIRAILFTAWYGVAAVIYNRRWTFIAPLSPDAKWFVLVVMPAAAMYFLYHFVLEIAMHGRTPGKRMAGVHIVTREGGSPGVGALLTRNVFRLVDAMPLLYGVGLITALATRDHVRVGDMAAGTLLVYERPDIALSEPAVSNTSGERTLRSSDTEIIAELLLRWPHLDSDARQRLATAILARHGVDVAALAERNLHPEAPTAPNPNFAADPPPRGPGESSFTSPSAHTDTWLRAQLERLLRGTPP